MIIDPIFRSWKRGFFMVWYRDEIMTGKGVIRERYTVFSFSAGMKAHSVNELNNNIQGGNRI